MQSQKEKLNGLPGTQTELQVFAKFLFMLLFAKTRMGKDVVQWIKEKGLN